jgi:hypothetical protein
MCPAVTKPDVVFRRSTFIAVPFESDDACREVPEYRLEYDGILVKSAEGVLTKVVLIEIEE